MTDHELHLKTFALRRALSMLLAAALLLPMALLHAQETNAPAKQQRWGDFYLRQKPECPPDQPARR